MEYGKDGLIAAVYDKGVNENGDSVNMNETYYKFDGKGRLIRKVSKDPDNGESTTAYTYDATGKLVKKQTATIDPPTYKYKYDAKGRLAEVYVTQRMPQYEADGEWKGKTVEVPSDRYVYKYDVKGRLSEEWDFVLRSEDKPSVPSYKIIWAYNDLGQVIKVTRVNEEGMEMSREHFAYDTNGQIAKVVFNNGDEDRVYLYDYCKGCKQSWMK